ncbi:MAG: GNAT family N-acetyltransferase [Solirubrobacteraceae bacterium]|jgi:hypothetical protein
MQQTTQDINHPSDDGITLRPTGVADAQAVGEFLVTLAPGARPLCFFSQSSESRIADYWAKPDDAVDHFGLVAVDAAGAVVAHGAYIRMYGPRAELALDIAEGVDRGALGSLLVGRLAEVARHNGIRSFVAVGPVSNTEVIALFSSGADVPEDRRSWSVIEFPTSAPAPD